jgi:hypothetical protein
VSNNVCQAPRYVVAVDSSFEAECDTISFIGRGLEPRPKIEKQRAILVSDPSEKK